ncbi:MAG: ABC transporter ATP-binding protein [Ilumatobacteraceae bacterium]
MAQPLDEIVLRQPPQGALAEAFAATPDLVVIDEAASGLDVTGVTVLGELCHDHAERGGAVVWADQDSAPELPATARFRIRSGRLLDAGPGRADRGVAGRRSVRFDGGAAEIEQLIRRAADLGLAPAPELDQP